MMDIMARLTAFLTDLSVLLSDKQDLINGMLSSNEKSHVVASFKTIENEQVYFNKADALENMVEVRTFGRDPIFLEKNSSDKYVIAVPANWVKQDVESSKVAKVMMSSEGLDAFETRYINHVGFCLANITVMNTQAINAIAV